MPARHRQPRVIARRLVQQVSLGLVALLAAIAAVAALTLRHDPAPANPDPAAVGGLVLGERPSPAPSIASSIAAPPLATSSPSAAATTDEMPVSFAAVNVGVYNTTASAGLAAKVAQRLKTQGWKVTTVGGFASTLTRSTVYYDPAHEQAAKWLAAHDPQVKVAELRPSQIRSNGGLIVAIASDAL